MTLQRRHFEKALAAHRLPGLLPARAAGAAPAALVALAVTLAGCHSTPSAHKASTTTTPAALPPKVIAYVALAGTGANLGFGTSVVPVNVTTSAASVGTAIHVGTYPDAVAVSPDHLLALVANFTTDNVTPIDLATGKALAPIPAGPGPAGIAITPDGSTAYVTDDGTLNSLADTVTPIDLKTMKPLAPIKVGGGPQGIAITPDGSKAFVADAGSIIAGQPGRIGHQVTPIDLATRRALKPDKRRQRPAQHRHHPGRIDSLRDEPELRERVADQRRRRPVPRPDRGGGRTRRRHSRRQASPGWSTHRRAAASATTSSRSPSPTTRWASR